MVDPLTGAVIVQGALGAIQLGVGLAKARAATRPEYILPSAIEEQMSEAQRMSYYGLPEAQKQEFLDNIGRSTAGAVRGASDRRGGLGAVATASQMEQDAYKGLLSADAAARMQNLNRLQDIRSNYAQYEDKAFSLNELEPYMQEVMASGALQGAGMQNIGGALNTLAMGSIYEVLGGQGGEGVTKGTTEGATGVQSATSTNWQDMISGHTDQNRDLSAADLLSFLTNQTVPKSDGGQAPNMFDVFSTMGSIGR